MTIEKKYFFYKAISLFFSALLVYFISSYLKAEDFIKNNNAQSLSSLARLGYTDQKVRSIWFAAARAGKEDILIGLVKRGIDPNIHDEKGYTAVILATYYNHLSVVKSLVELGAKPCGMDWKGNTALMGAAFKGEADILAYLAQKSCPVDTQNQAGQTALMMASLFGQDKVVKLLLDLGANPELYDHSGATALKLAQVQGNSEIISLLENTNIKKR